MRQNMEAGFEFGFVEADRHFHEVLVQAAGNKRLARVYRQAPLPLAPFPEHDDGARGENMRETLDDHRRMCDLLEKGRLDDAVALLRRHLLRDHRTLTPRGKTLPRD
jgi:DNA-binding GntR family transcriptional regulator